VQHQQQQHVPPGYIHPQPGYYQSAPHPGYYPPQPMPGQYPGHPPQPRPHTHIHMNPPAPIAPAKPVEPTAPEIKEWLPSSNERTLLDHWFDELDESHTGHVGGAAVVNFLKASNVSKDSLRLIWSLVDSSKRGSLDRHQFYQVMRFVAIAISPIYAGTTPSVERFNDNLYHEFALPTMSNSKPKTNQSIDAQTPPKPQVVGISAFDEMADELVSKSVPTIQQPQQQPPNSSQLVHQPNVHHDGHGAPHPHALPHHHQGATYPQAPVPGNPYGYPHPYPPPQQQAYPGHQYYPPAEHYQHPPAGNGYPQPIYPQHPYHHQQQQQQEEEFSDFASAEVHPPAHQNQNYELHVTPIQQQVVPSQVNLLVEEDEFSDFAEATVHQPQVNSTPSPAPVIDGPFGNLLDITPQAQSSSSSNPSITLSREFDEIEYSDFSSAPTTPSHSHAAHSAPLPVIPAATELKVDPFVGSTATGSMVEGVVSVAQVSHVELNQFEPPLSPVAGTNKLSVFDDLVEMDLQAATEEWDDFAQASSHGDSNSHTLEANSIAPAVSAYQQQHQEIDLLGEIVEVFQPNLSSSHPSMDLLNTDVHHMSTISYPATAVEEDFDADFGDFHSVPTIAVDHLPPQEVSPAQTTNSLMMHLPSSSSVNPDLNYSSPAGGSGMGMVFMFDDTPFAESVTPHEITPPRSPHAVPVFLPAPSAVMTKPMVSSHKHVEAMKYDRLAEDLLQHGYLAESWHTAQHANLLEDLEILKQEKQIAVDADELERAVQLKAKIQIAQSQINATSSHQLEGYQKLVSGKKAALDYAIQEDVEIISSYDVELGQLFQQAYAVSSLPELLSQRIEFITREKRTYRLILALFTSHSHHRRYWKEILTYGLSTFTSAETMISSLETFSASERQLCLENLKFRSYIDAIFMIQEAATWVMMSCEEAFVLKDLVQQNKAALAKLSRCLESFGIQPFEVKIMVPAATQPKSSSNIPEKYCDLTLRPLAEAKMVTKLGRLYLQVSGYSFLAYTMVWCISLSSHTNRSFTCSRLSISLHIFIKKASWIVM
jgi:hypothetical protein